MNAAKKTEPQKMRCIYMIRSINDGRAYVGKSSNFNSRTKQHLYHLKKGMHSNEELQQAWLQEDAEFELYILEVVSPSMCEEKADDLLCEREAFYQSLLAQAHYRKPEARLGYGEDDTLAILPPLLWEDAGENTVGVVPFTPLIMTRRLPGFRKSYKSARRINAGIILERKHHTGHSMLRLSKCKHPSK